MHFNNVVSLFDGMSCGQVALKRAGLTFGNYYASEIEADPIKITTKNHPETVQLGDVTKIRYRDGFLITENKAKYVGKVGLPLAGSPCQGFSFAGKMLNFDDPRSKLFFEFVRLLKEFREQNPDIYFLLENVKMKKEYEQVISETLGVEPVFINSSLVSAQSRPRLYWTNIPGVEPPEDLGLKLVDVLETDVDSKYYHSKTAAHYMSATLSDGRPRWSLGLHGDSERDKSACLVANLHKGQPYNVLIERKIERLDRQLNPKNGTDKAAALVVGGNGAGNHRLTDWVREGDIIRRYTPIECERLQTLPDDYTAGVSNSARYKMIGNGWTVDVIVHILKNLK